MSSQVIIHHSAIDHDWLIQGAIDSFKNTLLPDQMAMFDERSLYEFVERQMEEVRKKVGGRGCEIIATDPQGQRIGFSWVVTLTSEMTGEEEGFVLLLYVNPEHRNKGAGKALLRASEDWVKGIGLRHIALSVGVRNENALALYHQQGFQDTTIRMLKNIELL